MTKQVIRFGAAVMTTLFLLVVLWQFRIVVAYVVISLIIASALRPLANRLVGRSTAIRVVWILIYLVVLAGAGVILFRTSETAIKEVQLLAQSVSVRDQWQLPLWLVGSPFELAVVDRLPPPSLLFEAVTGSQGQLVLPIILGFMQGFGGMVSGGLIILFLSIYWSSNQVHFERLWLSLLPSGQRKQVRGIWRTIEPDIGAYFRGQIGQSLLTGLAIGIGLWLLGSPYPALLALVGAVASLIPMIGIVLAVIPVLIVGLLTSVPLSLLTGLYVLIVFTALIIWVKPRLFKSRWDNPILTVFLLIAFADAFGLAGIILAPPLSVVIQILWRRLISHRHAVGAAAQVSDLRERFEHVWTTIRAMDEMPLPLVTSSMERLTHILENAEPILLLAQQAEQSEISLLPRPVSARGGKGGS